MDYELWAHQEGLLLYHTRDTDDMIQFLDKLLEQHSGHPALDEVILVIYTDDRARNYFGQEGIEAWLEGTKLL